MKKLNIYIVIGLVALLFSSCSPYIKVFEVTATGPGMKKSDKSIVFENDTLIVTYNLWDNRGTMYYTVYNKMNVPIYVDWKRSAYIYNLKKYNYWIDKTSSESVKIPYVIPGTKIVSYTEQTTTLANERNTFIPPNSYVELPYSYVLMSGDVTSTSKSMDGKKIRIETVDFRNDKSVTKVKVNKTWKKKGQTTVYEKAFTESDSPIKFRNFMTYSTNEDFRKEGYVNTSFNVAKITEMKGKQFYGKFTKGVVVVKRGKKSVVTPVKLYDYPYKSNDCFYYNIFQP